MSNIFFIENPLVDISKEFQDLSILDKYQLQHGQASLATEKQLSLYDELFQMENIETIPGGSTLNSCRAANFILKKKNICTYFGSIGQDKYGDLLQKTLQDLSITSNFHREQNTPTGTCACIIYKNERTLCANLAAALKYPLEHLIQNQKQLDQATLIYSSAFFITSNHEALMHVAKHANATNTPFGFNLSAVFLIQFNLDQILEVLPYVDYLFTNEDEAAAFGSTQGILDKDLTLVGKCLCKWRKINEKRQRVVIITQGSQPVIVITQQEQSEKVDLFEIQPIEKSLIVDTNGAGDSFVGGFLSQIYLGNSIEQATKTGNSLARHVVQRSGCSFADDFQL